MQVMTWISSKRQVLIRLPLEFNISEFDSCNFNCSTVIPFSHLFSINTTHRRPNCLFAFTSVYPAARSTVIPIQSPSAGTIHGIFIRSFAWSRSLPTFGRTSCQYKMEAPQSPAGPQQHYGRDWLELLVCTDFLDTKDLAFVHAFRNRYQYQELLLYEQKVEKKDPGQRNKNKQQDDMTHRYLVVMDPKAKSHLGSSYRPSDHPESNVDIDYDDPKRLFESMVSDFRCLFVPVPVVSPLRPAVYSSLLQCPSGNSVLCILNIAFIPTSYWDILLIPRGININAESR